MPIRFDAVELLVIVQVEILYGGMGQTVEKEWPGWPRLTSAPPLNFYKYKFFHLLPQLLQTSLTIRIQRSQHLLGEKYRLIV